MDTVLFYPWYFRESQRDDVLPISKQITSLFKSINAGTSLSSSLQKELSHIISNNNPQDLLKFWKQVNKHKIRLLQHKSVERSADAELLLSIEAELNTFFSDYIWNFQSIDANISLLRGAYRSKNRLQIIRAQRMAQMSKVILPYIHKTYKTEDEWNILTNLIKQFLYTVDTYKKDLTTSHDEEIHSSVQEQVDTILKNATTAYIPGLSPKSIKPNKHDSVIRQEIHTARTEKNLEQLEQLSEEMIARLENYEFPPSTKARENFDFHSSTLQDHIDIITQENPLLMDTLEFGPVEIVWSKPYKGNAQNGNKQHEVIMRIRGRKGKFLIDTPATFVGELLSPKIIGMFNEHGELQKVPYSYFSVKYFQFKKSIPEIRLQQQEKVVMQTSPQIQEEKPIQKPSLWSRITSWFRKK